MKNIKNSLLVIMLLASQCNISAMSTQNNYLYTKSNDHSDPNAVNRLTNESYISPEMQWAALSFLGKKSIHLNKTTGMVEDLQSVDVMLVAINQQLNNQISNAQKESMKDALHAMLEATEIATFVANIEAAYKDPEYIFYKNTDSQLVANLNAQKQAIQTSLDKVKNMQAYDQPASSSSYFSWIWGSNTTATPQDVAHPAIIVPFDTATTTILLPAELMPAIIKNNDFKETADPVDAANLLFKQCFIAQQHHLKDSFRIKSIAVNLQSPLSATRYVFSNFPNIYDKNLRSYPICQIAQFLATSKQRRTDIQAPLIEEQEQAHLLLLHIRQAIQTALYIANKKSNVNFGYLLPASVTSYLDSIVSQLTQYDAELSRLCKDPLYGATIKDIYRDEQWATITKIAAGTIVFAAITGATVVYGPSAIQTVSGMLPSMWTGSSNQTSTPPTSSLDTKAFSVKDGQSIVATSPATPNNGSWFPSWTNGSSQSAPVTPSALPQKTNFETAVQYAQIASAVSGATAMASGTILAAEKTGYIAPLDESTRSLVQNTGAIAGGASVLTGAASAVGGAVQALTNWNSIFSPFFAVNALAGANNSLQRAGGYVQAQTGYGQNVQQNLPNQAQSQALPSQVPPQFMYDKFTQSIEKNIAQGINPVTDITRGTELLLEKGAADPQALRMVLEQLQQDQAQNPEIADSLGQLVQKIYGPAI